MVDFHTHAKHSDLKLFKKHSITPFISGYSIEVNKEIVEKMKSHIYYIGIAPQEAQRLTKKEIDQHLKFIEEHTKYAIGEIGLDFHWGKREEQIKKQYYAFESQIRIAKNLDKPIVIHSRKSIEKIIEVLKKNRFDNKVVFHFYSSSLKISKTILEEFDAYFSIVFLHSKERKKVIKETPLERLVVETDFPYVGKTPKKIFESIAYISEVKEVEEAEVKRQTTINAFYALNLRRPEVID